MTKIRSKATNKEKVLTVQIGNFSGEVPDVDKRVIVLMTTYQQSTKLLIDQYQEDVKRYSEYLDFQAHIANIPSNGGIRVSPPDYEALSTLQRPFLAKWIEAVKLIRAKEPNFPYNKG